MAFLVTLTAQLAATLHFAVPDGAITILQNQRPYAVGFYHGLSGSPGIAIGTIVLPTLLTNLASVVDRVPQDTTMEEAVFRKAVDAVQNELSNNREHMQTRLPSEVRAIFDVHELILGSNQLVEDTIARIQGGNWAPGALRDTNCRLGQNV